MLESSSSTNPIRARVFISGTVQGVGYRFSTVQKANELQIEGWVRNLRDGRVEAVFEGDRQSVTAIIAWCHDGPPAAIVEDVKVEYEQPEGLQGFETRWDL